jgi:hypothetical protein
LTRGLAKEACKSAQIWQAADYEDDGVLERHSKRNRIGRVEPRGALMSPRNPASCLRSPPV